MSEHSTFGKSHPESKKEEDRRRNGVHARVARTTRGWGEVAALRVGRVDFLGGTIEVAESVVRGERGRVAFGPPKSQAGRRVIAAPRFLLDELAGLCASRGLTGADADKLLFTDPAGKPSDYPWWRRCVWLPSVEAAGLEGLKFHDLRRAAATALVAEGVDMKTAQTRLGHADIKMTVGLYAQASQEADRDAAERVAERYTPAAWDRRGKERGA